MIKLLIRPKPHSDESLQQYILRLANKNGYRREGMVKLLKQTGHASLHLFKEAERDLLKNVVVKLTGHEEVAQLFDHKVFYNKCRIIFDYHRIKFCPLCLFDNKKWSLSWHYRHTLVCNKHKCLLVDRCSLCLEVFSEQSLILMRCTNCHADLVRGVNRHSLIPNQIDKYYSCRSIAEVADKANALLPYFALYEEKSYELWSKKNLCSISELLQIINGVLNLFYNKEARVNAFKKMIACENEGLSIGQSVRKVERFLSHDRYPEFTCFFTESLFILSKLFPSRVISCIWMDRLYKTQIMKAQELGKGCHSDASDQNLVFLNSGRHVIFCENLEYVLQNY
ncbi:MAG: TniQ family protein [Psychromonas sp.]